MKSPLLSLEPQIKSPLKRSTLRSRLSRAVSFRGSLVSWPTVGRKVSPIYGLGLPSHLRHEEISYSADSWTDRACILYIYYIYILYVRCAGWNTSYELQLHFWYKSYPFSRIKRKSLLRLERETSSSKVAENQHGRLNVFLFLFFYNRTPRSFNTCACFFLFFIVDRPKRRLTLGTNVRGG